MSDARDAAQLRGWLRQRLSAISGIPESAIAGDRPLSELGVSSVQAVSLVSDLSTYLGRELSTNLIWNRPTIDALVEELTSVPRTSRAAASPRDGSAQAPVAIVGTGCRLPGGVDGPDDLWALLMSGEDAISDAGPERWTDFGIQPDEPNLAEVPPAGGFLADVAGFDADFFGILPREAELMDPQQRILLEVTWNALEDAGIAPQSLRGTRTGVFVGASSSEYAHLTAADLSAVDAWTATGAAPSILANRISYLLDLRGPSLTVDTACSSSLVALHQACSSLASGECDTAIVSGVNLLLGPAITLNFARAGILAADGRCKPFDRDADGIVRGEGCGVVILRRLVDARADGSRVQAVVRGSAVGSDGRSNGLMAPNPSAQEDVLRDAVTVAGVDSSTIDYVETHGTGTSMGDPIEAGALGEVHGPGRSSDRPLLIGSVKATLGHLEAAAGIVGLIKVVLAMTHDCIPPSLHFHEANPGTALERNGLEVVSEARGWPRYSGRAVAGVSAFGFGGTNAHAVLEAWPQRRGRQDPESQEQILALGAPDTRRLADLARRLADSLETAPEALPDVAYSLARRDPGRVRKTVVGRTRSDLVARLRDVDASTATESDAAASGAVWVFSGFGSQHAGMASGLLASDHVFAAEVDRLDPLFVDETHYGLRDALATTESGDLMNDQLALFGTQLALAATWQARGVRPAAVVGHSMGEVAAAVFAGALDAREGVRVMAARSRLLTQVDQAGSGSMAALEVTEDELADLCRAIAPDVELAVHASPSRVTVAGPEVQVRALADEVEGQGRFARLMKVGGAGHSRAVEPLVPRLREALGEVSRSDPEVSVFSTVTPAEAPAFDLDYWCANLRRTVRFTEAINLALDAGHRAFLEVSPHPIATSAIEETADDRVVLATGTLRRDGDDLWEMAASEGRLHEHGHPTVLRHRYDGGRLVDLPPTRWEHRRYWPTPRSRPEAPAGHPLLGSRAPMPGKHVWHTDVGTDHLPWLAHHEALGAPVLPGAAFLEMVLSGAVEAWAVAAEHVRITDLVLHQVLPLTTSCPVTVVLTETGPASADVEILSHAPGGTWLEHATATVHEVSTTVESPAASFPGGDEVDVYARFAAVGQEYGPAFRGVVSARAAGGLAAATVRLPAEAGRSAHDRLHPALVDASLHVLAAAVPDSPSAAGSAYLPVSIGSVEIHALPDTEVEVLAEIAAGSGDDLRGAVRMLDSGGRTLVTLTDVGLRPVDTSRSSVVGAHWISRPLPSSQTTTGDAGPWIVLAPSGAGAWVEGCCARLASRGTVVGRGDWSDDVTALARTAEPTNVVVAFPTSDGPGPPSPRRAEYNVQVACRVAAQLSELGGITPRLWLISEGAGVVSDTEVGSADAAALRGLVRVLTFEHPELRATLLDLERGRPGTESGRRVCDEVDADSADDEIAYRHGRRYVARLSRIPISIPPEAPPVVRDGAYVVSGGLGGLGLTVAQWLADRGARRLVLSGRRGETAESAGPLAALRASECDVRVVAGDLAEPGVADRLVAVATEGGVPLRGVVHAAGVLADAAVAQVEPEDLHRVWWPKAWAARQLHTATSGQALDWWLSFSSAAGLVGSPGQASYATANAWLDAFTAWQRADGVRATTISWGAWATVGGAAGNDNAVLEPLDPDDALAAMERVLASGVRQVGVAKFAADRAVNAFAALHDVPFLDVLIGEVVRDEDDASVLDEVQAAPPGAQRRILRDRLRSRVASIVGTPADVLVMDQPLADLGLDSLMAMRARNAVNQDFGITVPVSLLLRDASLIDIADHVATELGLAEGESEDLPAIHTTSAPRSVPHVGPRDTAERLVASLCSAVLNQETLGALDDIADLGAGPSDLDIIAERLGERLDCAIDAAQLATSRTVEAIADTIRVHVEPRPGEVVRVLRDGTAGDPAMFFFHPAGGPTTVYGPLVERLPPPLRCFGLERLDDVDDVESKARLYVDHLLEIGSPGPYLLSGWSFGGVLAYEVARQLRADGHEVGLVAMIDSILPLEEDEEDTLGRFRRFIDHIEQTYGSTVPIDWESLAAASEDDQIKILMDTVAAADLGIGAAALRHQYTSYVDARVAERYHPQPYDGPVVLYRASEPHPLTTSLDPRYLRTDAALGWDALCADLEVVQIPGDHLSLVDPPGVDAIAGHVATRTGVWELS